MSATAVVTGAGGHLGNNLVRALLAGDRYGNVRAVDLRRGPSLAGLDIEFAEGDVGDAERLRRLFAGAEVVFHLAARISIAGDPDGGVWRTNVDGVATAAGAALAVGVGRFVLCSSLHAFDVTAAHRAGTPVDESAPPATDPALPAYDRSKAAGEEQLRRVAGGGLDVVVCNPSGIVGPHDFEPSRMGRTLLACFRGRMPAVVPGAFDWVDVRDVAGALAAAAEQGRTGENYLVGGQRAPVAELFALAAGCAGRRPPPLVLPAGVVRAAAGLALRLTPPGRARGRLLLTPESLHALDTDPVVVTAKARAELGYAPRPLVETLADTHAWFRTRGLL